MCRRGNCYDNALAEAFVSTLKIELVYRQDSGITIMPAKSSSNGSRPYINSSAFTPHRPLAD